MTEQSLEPGGPGADPRLVVSDVESCLVLVMSHISASRLVEAATTEAARRLMMSPMLADFIEFRYAHIGPGPGPGGNLAAVRARITDNLIQPRPDVGRSFFAVVIMDQSAATVEAVLRECADSAFLAALPIRLYGIASREDRHPPRPPKGAEILVSPAGAWRRDELIDELGRRADALFHNFAVGRQAGVTPEQLAQYRDQFAGHVADEPAEARPAAPAAGLPAISAAPPPGVGSPPAPDALDPSASDTPSDTPASDTTARGASGQPVAHPRATEVAPARSGWLGGLPRRLIPRMRRRAADDAVQEAPVPVREQGLAYLLITGDESSGDPAAWNDSRLALVEIDKRLAVIPGMAIQVRALQGEEELGGSLRPAGQLTKREAQGTVADLYFAGALAEIQRTLGRDQARLAAWGLPLARPAVVIFAPAPPFADSEAVGCLRRLAQDASVVWVVPRNESALLSDDFKQVGRVITDFASVAEDVAALFPAFSIPGAHDADAVTDQAGTGTNVPDE